MIQSLTCTLDNNPTVENFITVKSTDSSILTNSMLFQDLEIKTHKISKLVPPETTYARGSKVEVTSGETQFSIPMSLYHLLYIHSLLKSANTISNKDSTELWDKLPFIRRGISMQNEKYPPSLSRMTREKSNEYYQTMNAINEMIIKTFECSGVYDTGNLTWNDIEKVIKHVLKEIKEIKNTIFEKLDFDEYELRWIANFYHNIIFLYKNEITSKTFKRIIATEWTSPPNTHMFYRGAIPQNDKLFPEGKLCSLSFGYSALSGMFFESDPKGTCPLVYHRKGKLPLYALRLTEKQIKKYMFVPEIYTRYPHACMNGSGEFSHPRLRMFAEDDDTTNDIVEIEFPELGTFAIQIASFSKTDKISSKEQYLKKIQHLYEKAFILIE